MLFLRFRKRPLYIYHCPNCKSFAHRATNQNENKSTRQSEVNQIFTPTTATFQGEKLSKCFRFYWAPRGFVRSWKIWKALVSFGNWSTFLLFRLQFTNPTMLKDLWDSKTLSSILHSCSSGPSSVCGVFWVNPEFSTQQNSLRVTERFCFIKIWELFTFVAQCLMSSEKGTKNSLICLMPLSNEQCLERTSLLKL